MANFKSTQYTNETAAPHTFGKGHEYAVPVRKYFAFTVPAGTAANDTVQLVSVPKGAVLVGGKFAQDALGNAIQLGDGTTAGKYLGSTSTAAAGETFFGNTLALNFGEELAAALILTATITTGAWTAAKILSGYIEYRLPS